jgi:hypothetical protein
VRKSKCQDQGLQGIIACNIREVWGETLKTQWTTPDVSVWFTIWLADSDYNGGSTTVGPENVKLCLRDYNVHEPSKRRHLTDRASAAACHWILTPIART